MATLTRPHDAKTVRPRINIANRLSEMAAKFPNATAVAMPIGKKHGTYRYQSVTFAQLEDDSNRIAAGLVAYGLRPGREWSCWFDPASTL